ncbi:hypothetical protein CYMTET_47972 [Cymbomonas tetramitiformis]|uniref:Uncharacterized protein n=1 Tax=Cymbomonas tetramitiformis TaxID=36881 RepID=A0AAE0BT67_9CHLO|nr:hypothetical protein CYMTET_47972 [Cymbomonas tetramitiformis]
MELEELVRVELNVSAVEVEVEGKYTMEVTDALPLAMVFTDTSVVETPAAAAIWAAKSARKVVLKVESSNAVMLRVEKVMAEDTPETTTVPGEEGMGVEKEVGEGAEAERGGVGEEGREAAGDLEGRGSGGGEKEEGRRRGGGISVAGWKYTVPIMV